MMQKILYPERARWPELTRRPAFSFETLEAQIAPVLADVRARGEEAVRAYTRRFDGVEIDDPAVPPEALAAAREAVPADLRAAIRLAKRNIETFHAAQVERPVRIETAPGVVCRRKSVAIERVGLYVPGGTAPLFSTVLMLGIPARLAGCREVVLCTPPGPDGAVHPALLFAAHLLGLDRVFRIGGAQAVAAMAYGAGSVPRVDKIFGPGNQYVTVAKQLVSREGVAIDMPAGPTEVAVVIDETARPDFVAADLLSQAEHGPDSQVVLLSTCLNNVDKVLEAVRRQLESLPRKSIAEQSLAHSKAVVFETMEEVMDFANAYAAEHLILAVENPEALAERVVNAGSVFLGHLTPEAVGDYASGTNHTLPTNGYARAYAGVSVDAFVKKITFQALTEEGLRSIGPAVETMARAEALDGHARAVTIRLAALDAAPPPALPPRVGRVHRQTKETDVHVALDLDGRGRADVHTGLGFFDHMLEQIARHAGFDLTVHVAGDLHVDEHHTIEDTALALGAALLDALGDKRGIERYGFLLPMDDALAQVALDLSGRSWLVWDVPLKRERLGDVPAEMFFHFFKSFSDAAKCNLNVKAEGENEHHVIEAVFKAFARALRQAVRRDADRMDVLPSTKGTL